MAVQDVIHTDRAQSPLDQVPGLRQLLLLLAIAAAVAVGVWAVLWSQEERYTVVFGNLADRDAAEIVQALDAAQIPNRYRAGSGTVLVPHDRVHEARLQLASQDLPASGGVGFEMLSESNGIADSQFMETARYQRALEVELQRTIASISAVRTARVHLAVPRQSVFVRDRRPAGASVLVNLFPGRRLTADQVNSIVNLVASSVPEMESNQVTVVNQSGELLSMDPGERPDPASEAEERIQRMEERYRERITSLLTPLVGAGRVRAEVAVSLNPEVREETQEIYDPANQVVRSEQSSEQTRAGTAARGVPGALSNQPPAGNGNGEGGQAGAQGQNPEGGDGAEQTTSSELLRNYEIGRTIRYVQQPMGDVRRISAAVVVDQKRITNADGETEVVPHSDEELARMTELVRQAIGIEEGRGDRVSVVNAPFQENASDLDGEAYEPGLLDRIDVVGVLRMGGIVLLLLLLIFAVVRPTLRQLLMTLPPRTMHLPSPSAQTLPQSEQDAGAASPEAAAADSDPKRQYDDRIATAKSIVKQDPKRVAQVVRQWVNEDGG